MSQHRQNPLTQPVIEASSLEKGAAFNYAARFEVAPEITPKDYDAVEVRRRPGVVTDEQVAAALEEKRKEMTEIRPLPDPPGRENTRPGDVWTIDVDGTFASSRVAKKDLQVEIGTEATVLVPGLVEQLAELPLAAVGTTRQLRFQPPQDRLRDEFKDQEVSITVAFREVREKVVPELDDEFAKDTDEAETLEELRAKIRENLLEEDKMQAEQEARQRLVETLLERNRFEVAPSLVQRELAAQVNLFKQQVKQQGLTLAQLGTSDSQLAQRMRPESLFRVKAFLLLDAIGKKHAIETTEEELDAEVAEMATARGQNPARLRATMEKDQRLLLLRHQIRESKILDYLMEQAKVTEAPDPSPESPEKPAETGDSASA
jgi:trigger factor